LSKTWSIPQFEAPGDGISSTRPANKIACPHNTEGNMPYDETERTALIVLDEGRPCVASVSISLLASVEARE
jgi:hypothetical protein